MRRNQKGFTLMELMVVIVIVAILAAVAVPLITGTPTYTTTLASLNVDLSDVAGKWTVTIPSANATSFTVLATGVAGSSCDGLTEQVVYTKGAEPAWTP